MTGGHLFLIALLAIAAAAMPVPAIAAEPECGDVAASPALAVEICTKAIDSGRYAGTELAKLYYSRGTTLAQADDFESAIADYNVAAQLDPANAPAFYNRALAWSARGESGRAIADYDAALRLSPNDANALMGRAVEWSAKGETGRAIADYDEAIRLGIRASIAYFGRGRAKFYAGDFTGAASDFYRSHQLDATMYSAIWIYLARKRADIPGEKTLANDSGTDGAGAWPAPIVALYLGKSTAAAVQEAAAHFDTDRHRTQRCEANYYIAQWHILRRAREDAIPLLREAITGCPHTYIEHEAALAELRRLEKIAR